MIGIGILIVLVGLVFYALIRSAVMAAGKLKEPRGLTAEREAGGSSGAYRQGTEISKAFRCY